MGIDVTLTDILKNSIISGKPGRLLYCAEQQSEQTLTLWRARQVVGRSRSEPPFGPPTLMMTQLGLRRLHLTAVPALLSLAPVDSNVSKDIEMVI